MSKIENPFGLMEFGSPIALTVVSKARPRSYEAKKGETMAKAKAVKKGKKLGTVKPLMKIHPQTKLTHVAPLTRFVK